MAASLAFRSESGTMESSPLLHAGAGIARDEDLTGAATASNSGTWFAGYSARFAKTAEDTARVGAAVAHVTLRVVLR